MPDLREGDLQKKVTQVRRRQLLQTWLWQLPICVGGAVALAAIAYFAQLYFQLETQLTWWGALGILAGLGLAASVVLTAIRRPTAVDSALALDGAFNLRERVTTAISLTDEQKASPAGMALMEDVQKKITQLDVASRFPLAMPRTTWALPAAAAAFALVVIFYNPSQNIEAQTALKKKDAAKEEEKIPPIKTEEYKQNNEARKARVKDIDSEKLQTLQNQLDRLLEKVDGADKPTDVTLAAQEASKLAEDIKKRQDELNKVKEMMNKLRNTTDLKDAKDSPSSDLQKAMSEGDMQKAKEELDKLLQSMKEGKLTQEQKEQLAKQLDDLSKKLKDLAEQKERREQIEKSNLDPEAKKKELAKLDKQKEQLKELAQMAEKLSQCKDCLQKGDNDKAEQNLKDASAMIQEMLKDAQEAKELEAALEDVDKLKQELGDKGDKQKGATVQGEDEEGDPGMEETEDPTPKPGTDKRSRGGLRKDRANETKNKDERARSPLDPKGKIQFKGYGPEQPKPDRDSVGKTTVEIGEGILESKHEATEALRGQRIPQAQKNVVTDFYSNLVDPNRDKKKEEKK